MPRWRSRIHTRSCMFVCVYVWMCVCIYTYLCIMYVLYVFVNGKKGYLLSYVLSLGVVACNHFFLSPRNFGPNLVGFRAFFPPECGQRTQNVGEGYPHSSIQALRVCMHAPYISPRWERKNWSLSSWAAQYKFTHTHTCANIHTYIHTYIRRDEKEGGFQYKKSKFVVMGSTTQGHTYTHMCKYTYIHTFAEMRKREVSNTRNRNLLSWAAPMGGNNRCMQMFTWICVPTYSMTVITLPLCMCVCMYDLLPWAAQVIRRLSIHTRTHI